MSPTWLPPAEFYAALPRHISSAAVILHDKDGRILLVRPWYRDDTWELPGGATDDGESPWQAARREVSEELGLELRPGRLLLVDWLPAQADPARPPLANYVFDGGLISPQDAAQQIRLQTDELTAWRLAAPDEWDHLLIPHMARRLHACTETLRTGGSGYLEEGRPPQP